MKKVFSIGLLACLMLIANFSFAEIKFTLSIENLDSLNSDTSVVAIYLNSTEAISGLQFNLLEDDSSCTSFEVVGFNKGEQMSDEWQVSFNQTGTIIAFVFGTTYINPMNDTLIYLQLSNYSDVGKIVKLGLGGLVFSDIATGQFPDSCIATGEEITWIVGRDYPMLTDISPNDLTTARTFYLSQNYPNPFNPTTEIRYEVPFRDVVSLNIYNLRGELIRSLMTGIYNPGYYSVTWNAKNDRGVDVASGVYIYRLETGDRSISKKMMLMR